MTRSSSPLPPTLDFLRELWRLNHAMERRSSVMLRTLGITAQQRMVMRCIAVRPGSSAGALAELLHVDPGTMSTTLGRLEERGYVVRLRDPADGRRIVVRLTADGESVIDQSAETVESAVEALLREQPPRAIASGLALIERFASLLEADKSVSRPHGRVRRGQGSPPSSSSR